MKEALKLALEALDAVEWHSGGSCWIVDAEKIDNAITAIKEALAQPKQEPVAWRAPNWGHGDDEWVYRDFDDPVLIADGKPSPNNEPLYATPPQRTWVGLTDEEVIAASASATYMDDLDAWTFAKAIEEKLKEKNNG